MANAFNNALQIARQSLVEFDNDFVLSDMVYRDYEGEFGPKASGDVVNIRRPLDFTPQSGRVTTPQDITDANVQLRVDQQWNISYPMTSFEMTLKEDEMAERITRPLTRQLATVVEKYLMGLFWKIPAWVGTPGQLVNSYADHLEGVTYLEETAVPGSGRTAIYTPRDYSALAASNTALFSDGAVNPALRERDVKRLGDMRVTQSNLISRFTTGLRGGTPLINGASQNVTYTAATASNLWQQTLITDGWSNSITGVVKQGDVFTIAGVNSVNPVTKVDTGQLQYFTVMADANSNGSGQATITISPPIISSGSQQTVSAAPADNAAMTFKGAANTAYPQNLMIHKNAMALVMVPLKEPKMTPYAATVSYKGFSMRVTGGYDVINDQDTIRYDILFGADVINPRMATRISGTP